LNMTTVQVAVEADGRVGVDLKIDLTRASGGALEYYRLSLSGPPLEVPEIRSLLRKLAAAVVIRRAGGAPIPLEPVAAEFPTVTREAFLDPLSWPMTHVVLQGRLAAPSTSEADGPLEALFRPTFHFEEPIALTFLQHPGARRMTRWLVTAQVSPPFAVSLTAAAATDGPAPVSLAQFVVFGFEHILPRGLDHVLFVLGLYLGARSLKSLLVLVTAFTLAHSITLGLASIGIIRLSPALVEPLISASIAWVGIENCFSAARTERWRPFLAFGFGLVHGLGFAGALSTLDAPRESFLPSLLCFNAGIEAGQLTVIAVAWMLTVWCRRQPWYRTRVAIPASIAIAVVATVWTVQRLTMPPG